MNLFDRLKSINNNKVDSKNLTDFYKANNVNKPTSANKPAQPKKQEVKSQPSIEEKKEEVQLEQPRQREIFSVIFIRSEASLFDCIENIIQNLGESKLSGVAVVYQDGANLEIPTNNDYDFEIYYRHIGSREFNYTDLYELEFEIDLPQKLLLIDSNYKLNDDQFITKAHTILKSNNIFKVESIDIRYKHHFKQLQLNSFLYARTDIVFIEKQGQKAITRNIKGYGGFDHVPGMINYGAIKLQTRLLNNIYAVDAAIKQLQMEVINLNMKSFISNTNREDLKVSFIMQVYLGDYPGSRSNATEKFHRAVYSFLNLDNKNSELVIVSDGCKIAHDAIKRYKGNPRIKYAYVHKEGAKMYEESQDAKKYYRGLPRQIGLTIASGNYVTYMDSDDMLMPYAADAIIDRFMDTDFKFMLNGSWYDHESYRYFYQGNPKFEENNPAEDLEIPGTDIKLIQVKTSGINVNYAPWLLSHVKDIDRSISWEDLESNEISEDILFGRKMRDMYFEQSMVYRDPFYIRCHVKDVYDL